MRSLSELMSAVQQDGIFQPKSFTQANGIKDLSKVRFQDVINALEDEENILFCFPYNIDCCVAFTNKRVIEAGRMNDFFQAHKCSTYSYESINSVEGMGNYLKIKITGEGDRTYMPLRGQSAVAMATKKINDAILEYKAQQNRPTQMIVNQASSSADELKKFKELLDMGIITQEEFDAKKKQLLGL